MSEKKKARTWKGPHTMITIVAMLMQLALCNIFAGVDRQRLNNKANPAELHPPTPTVIEESTLAEDCPTIIPKRNLGAKCIARTRSS